jgi:hypothetical protein
MPILVGLVATLLLILVLFGPLGFLIALVALGAIILLLLTQTWALGLFIRLFARGTSNE